MIPILTLIPPYPQITILILFCFMIYALATLRLENIAKKSNTPNSWLSYIPFANIYLMCKIPGKSDWWGLLFFIPLVDIVILFIIIIWVEIFLGY